MCRPRLIELPVRSGTGHHLRTQEQSAMSRKAVVQRPVLGNDWLPAWRDETIDALPSLRAGVSARCARPTARRLVMDIAAGDVGESMLRRNSPTGDAFVPRAHLSVRPKIGIECCHPRSLPLSGCVRPVSPIRVAPCCKPTAEDVSVRLNQGCTGFENGSGRGSMRRRNQQ